ncbi:MAG TPA: ABC transporter ATP-binding protein [Gemmatimonadales bacterium]|nr:ABC transporter ATP-binding protein [Gemmatimonadales bacterium]
MTALSCSGLEIRYGPSTVLHGIDLEVGSGEALAVLGPSGSGKTTLMYAVAGFLSPAAGEIRLQGTLVADARFSVPPERRAVGVVFQNYALWPHLRAGEIVAYPLRRSGLPAREAAAEAARLLELVGVGELIDRRPAEMSGGQQQRVGLARALARRPNLYLFDEPTAHLDSGLRAALQQELVERRRSAGAAALYATHDAGEALAVADRVMVLREGRVVQIGTPQEIYERPADLWSARLTGPAWSLPGRMEGGMLEVLGAALPTEGAGVQGPVEAVIRPDWVTPGEGVEAVITAAWYRGPHTDYRLQTGEGTLEMRRQGGIEWPVGTHIGIRVTRAWPVSPGSSPGPDGPVGDS